MENVKIVLECQIKAAYTALNYYKHCDHRENLRMLITGRATT